MADRPLWPTCFGRPSVSFLSEAASRMTAMENRRQTACGRLPTDAILHPLTASPGVAAGRARKLTPPNGRLRLNAPINVGFVEKSPPSTLASYPLLPIDPRHPGAGR